MVEVPDGFRRRQVGRRWVVVLEERADDLDALGFVEGNARVEPLEILTGRAEHPIYQLPGSEVRVLWKRCTRGGIMGSILDDRHWSVERFMEELERSRAAIAVGLRVAEPLGLAVEEFPVGFKRVEMLSRIVDGARDLGDALGDPKMDGVARRRLLSAVAGELRRFHGHGFLHGDLNVKNILWRESEGPYEVTLIDLDPGAWRAARSLMNPHQNLIRLYRSYVKGACTGRWQVPATDLYRFLFTYFRGDRASIDEVWQRGRKKQKRWKMLRFRGRSAPEVTRS